MTSHHRSQTKEYKAWQRMKSCCQNPNVPYYPKYGGKGITICEEWMEFSQFLADMGPVPDGCNGVELIDPAQDFSKWNCQWVKKAAGRPCLQKEKSPVKPRNHRRVLNDPRTICLVLEKNHLDFIKNQALQRSLSEGVCVEANQLIREALQSFFPFPSQGDMFEARR